MGEDWIFGALPKSGIRFERHSVPVNVSFGSKADLTAPDSNFRYTPESGLIAPCPKSANTDSGGSDSRRAVTLQEQRIKTEKAERRRREDDQRHQQEADRRKIERNRWRRFLEISDRWVKVDRARRFIATIEASNSTDMASRGELSPEGRLTWAKKRLMIYDPLEMGIEISIGQSGFCYVAGAPR